MSSPMHPVPSAVPALRTLALVGAAASGKTTLVEALLHKAGAIGAPGSLERGTTVSDFDPLERRAQHSLHAALVHLQHQDTRDSHHRHARRAGLSRAVAAGAGGGGNRRPGRSAPPAGWSS